LLRQAADQPDELERALEQVLNQPLIEPMIVHHDDRVVVGRGRELDQERLGLPADELGRAEALSGRPIRAFVDHRDAEPALGGERGERLRDVARAEQEQAWCQLRAPREHDISPPSTCLAPVSGASSSARCRRLEQRLRFLDHELLDRATPIVPASGPIRPPACACRASAA
jgi:hypothetical protein